MGLTIRLGVESTVMHKAISITLPQRRPHADPLIQEAHDRHQPGWYVGEARVATPGCVRCVQIASWASTIPYLVARQVTAVHRVDEPSLAHA